MNVPSFAAIIAHAFRLGQQGTLRDTVPEVAYATAARLRRRMLSTFRARHHPCRFMGSSLLLPAMALLTVGCARSLPVVQGKVLDARTGQPIAGALVERRLFEKGPPDLVDSRTGTYVPESFTKVTTDDQGRFVLPAARVRALSGMAWFVYKPGWMPGFGCYQEEGWSSGSCGGSEAIVLDPYVKSNFVRQPDRIEMEVRVFPPTLEGVTLLTFDPRLGKFVPRSPDSGDDPWANYFQRLNAAVQQRYLTVDEFVKEAAAYAEKHPLTEGSLFAIGSLVPSGPCDTPYCRDPRIRKLTRAVVDYCDRTPDSEYCRPRLAQMIQRLREWLEKDSRHE